MTEPGKRRVRHLTALTVTGLILVFVPVSSVLIMVIYFLFRNAERVVITSAEGPSTMYLDSYGLQTEVFFIIVAAVFACGLGLLGYVGYKELRKRKNGKES